MSNANTIDLTGMKFGKLTVIKEFGHSKDGRVTWLCRCECGGEKIASGHDLKSGATKSCGCLRSGRRNGNLRTGEAPRVINRETGKPKRLYGVWAAIVQRCENPNAKSYKNYGGRGIKMCRQWRNDFSAFEGWAISAGYDEHAPQGVCTIDRIDNNGDYCPENCRWTTYKVQSNNRRNNRVLVCDGESHTLQEWAELLGIQDCILRDRIFKLGWDEETALKTPVRHCKRTKYRTVIQSADISRP